MKHYKNKSEENKCIVHITARVSCDMLNNNTNYVTISSLIFYQLLILAENNKGVFFKLNQFSEFICSK